MYLKIKVDNFVVELAELPPIDKQLAMGAFERQKEYPIAAGLLGAECLFRRSLKKIQIDNRYQSLEFNGDALSDRCLSQILEKLIIESPQVFQKLCMVALECMNGVPSRFFDHEGKPLTGVEILSDSNWN